MTNTRQFVACKFRIIDTRTFTYHNDGEPVHDGDTVRVPDKSGEGWKKAFVADANAEKPTAFETKAIIGPHVDEEPAADAPLLGQPAARDPRSADAILTEPF